MTEADLTGTRVVLTAQRKAQEFGAALQRRGVDVVHAATISHVPHVDDPQLLRHTRDLLAAPPHAVVVTTGVGFRGWLEAADGAGIGVQLRSVLADTVLLARGAKARGAVVGAGLPVAWTAGTETTQEITEFLVAGGLGQLGVGGGDTGPGGERPREAGSGGLSGLRIAVQHHGAGRDEIDASLREAGASVLPLVVYRWGPAPDPVAVDRAIGMIVRAEVDCVAFTSAPAVTALFEAADPLRVHAQLDDVLRCGSVIAAAVGDTTAAPLRERGIEPVVPERFRTGPLIRTITDALAQRLEGRAQSWTVR